MLYHLAEFEYDKNLIVLLWYVSACTSRQNMNLGLIKLDRYAAKAYQKGTIRYKNKNSKIQRQKKTFSRAVLE